MTSRHQELDGGANLTPFELTLAGAGPTEPNPSPSLKVIRDMQELAGSVDDVPIIQSRLQRLLSAPVDLGQDLHPNPGRPGLASGRVLAAGDFIDITPTDLSSSGISPSDVDTQAISESTAESKTESDEASAGTILPGVEPPLVPPSPTGDTEIPTGTILIPPRGADEMANHGSTRPQPPVVPAGPPVPPPRPQRFGSAFWALAGTAAAAALLALGGLFWANSLDRTNGGPSADVGLDQPEGPDAEDSATAADEGSAVGPTGEPDDFDKERPALEVEGEAKPDAAGSSPTTVSDSETSGLRSTTVPSVDDTAPTDSDLPEPTAAPTTPTTGPTTPTTEPAPTTTTQAPETTPAPSDPTFIGDRITVGSFDGPGLDDVTVELWADDNTDGVGERLVASEQTTGGGFYGFDDYPPGCYEVRFRLTRSGLEIIEALASQGFCLDAGDQDGRTDAVALVLPPDGCFVEPPGSRFSAGVEVYENDFEPAESYVFYGTDDRVVFRTSDSVGPDDVDPSSVRGDYEWHGAWNGFDHRDVEYVAAVISGVESTKVRCRR